MPYRFGVFFSLSLSLSCAGASSENKHIMTSDMRKACSARKLGNPASARECGALCSHSARGEWRRGAHMEPVRR
eukprot:4786559-Pyramimonas_sp.AAC.1